MSGGPREVVLTGTGTVGPFGIGLEALAGALAAGEPLGRPIEAPAAYRAGRGARTAARVPPVDLGAWVSPREARRMSRPSCFATAAARMALESAALAPDGARGLDTAICLSTAFGPGVFTEQLISQILEEGPRAASPFLFTDCVASAPAGQVAIHLGARGANMTICQREAGPLLAVIEGALAVAHGHAACCLVGAVDEAGGILHVFLDRMRALARAARGVREAPRPMDRRRNGVLLGEGSTVVVLETPERARARGARVFARVRAWARAFDPTASRSSWGTGATGLAHTLRRALRSAGLDLASIGAIVSGASGSTDGDRLEARVLQELFGRRSLPPLVAPKAVTGEYGGHPIAAAVLATCGAEFARPRQCTQPDLDVRLHRGRLDAARVLVSGLAAGGAAAWLVLERA